ncbi:MAG: M56 family metallopeptidase [Gemmatimonadaceae bacterium]
MQIAALGFMITPADSARAAAHVYSVSLLACLPLAIAALGALACRNASSQSRSLIWRSAIGALLIIYVGRILPMHWFAFSLPDDLAAPLVALGRLQLSDADLPNGIGQVANFVPLLLAAYWIGVALLLLPVARALISGSGAARRARPLRDATWDVLLDRARAEIGVRQAVRLLVTDEAVAPQTWGLFRFAILLPTAALEWSREQRHAVLLHELTHVRRRDPFFLLAARVACAFYWFHPGVWWASHHLANESEFACDDRVLEIGVRRSDYAELLVLASGALLGHRPRHATAVSIVGRGGLRARLIAITEPRQISRPATRAAAAVVMLFTLTTALPVSVVQLAPSRRALTTLMTDARWESRAYAVAGLAQRRDSVEVARTAARLDPSPRVRAWARYALAQPSGRDLPAVLSKQQ